MPDLPQFAELVWAQAELAASCGSAITLLPESSLHMTVFELLTDMTRIPEKWSSKLALDAPLAETDPFFRRVVPPIPAPTSLAMTFGEAGPLTQAIGVRLKPEATGLRFPDHDSYRFRISLAYRILMGGEHQRALDAAMARVSARLARAFGVFRPAPAQLVFFEDMFAFRGERH
ncbi:MAG: DUF1868 domain-containing protein [Thermoflexales bacterium]